MSGLKGKHLVLFMTRGVTLTDWKRIGMLDRELALYRRLTAAGLRVSIVTSGGKSDLEIARQIAPIDVLANRWALPNRLYNALLPWLHRRPLRTCNAIKSNQTAGAELARRCAANHGKPLLARCGYMLSQFERWRRGDDHPKTRSAEHLEHQVFSAAKLVQVTTKEMAEDVGTRCGDTVAERTRLVPNYVDSQVFAPRNVGTAEPAMDLIFVGRNSPQKNLAVLIEAVRDLPIRVGIIGAEDAEAQYEPQLSGGQASVEWIGQVPHNMLADQLRSAKAFVLPSRYEGHPKALIEAMSCGLPAIVADRPGLREVVEHGVTGYLCEPEPASLRDAIQTVLGDASLRRSLGQAARSAALERYSLDRVITLETAVLEELMRDD